MATVLVTGGGSGIGRELIRLFAADNYAIVVFSLVQKELDELSDELAAKYPSRDKAGEFSFIQADLAQVNAAQKVFDWCVDHHHSIDVLVNNAGFSIAGEHVDQHLDTVHNMLSLNMITLAELSLLFGRQMKVKGQGKILNIGSTTGISPLPLSAAYSASKAFVNSLSVSLSVELAPYGVQVSCMEPYLTKTKFLATCSDVSANKNDSPADIAKQEKTGHSVEMVADYAYRGLHQGKAIILPGKLFSLLAFIMRVLPQKLVADQLYKLTKRNA